MIRQQAKDLDQLMNERDTLGSQLVRRNDELALLYEKIRILQSTLHRGNAVTKTTKTEFIGIILRGSAI